MFPYKNKVTGAIITTFGKVNGENWVQVKDTKSNKANDAKNEEKEPDGE